MQEEKQMTLVVDFDGTLTTSASPITHQVFPSTLPCYRNNNNNTHTVLGVAQEDMNSKYTILLENSQTLDDKERVMEGWWAESHGQLSSCSIHRDSIAPAARNLLWRKGCLELLTLLVRHQLSCVIYSAGIADVIEEGVKQLLGNLPSNVRVVANRMIFNQEGFLIGFAEPVFHSLNKTFTRLPDVECALFSHCRHIVLVGDSESDCSMLQGWGCDDLQQCLKVRIMDEPVAIPKDDFDVHVTDGSLLPLLSVIKSIIQ